MGNCCTHSSEIDDEFFDAAHEPQLTTALPERPSAPYAAAPLTRSEELREEGNVMFRTVDTVPPLLKAERLQRALNLYKRAQDAATTDSERASAVKNVASGLERRFWISDPPDTASLLQSILLACAAIELGQTATPPKSHAWLASLADAIAERADAAHDIGRGLGFDEEARLRSRVIAACDFLPEKARFCLELGERLFLGAVVLMDREDFRSAARHLADAARHLADCQRHSAQSVAPSKVAGWQLGWDESWEEGGGAIRAAKAAELLAQVAHHRAICEAVQMRLNADAELVRALAASEALDVTAMWHVVDLYRGSLALARDGCDLEQEAVACARLGKVFSKVLGLPDKAAHYYRHALQRAMALRPRSLRSEAWFRESSAFMQSRQMQALREEERSRAAARAPAMAALKLQLAALAAESAQSWQALMRHLAAAHAVEGAPLPPAVQAGAEAAVSASAAKSLLKEALTLYGSAAAALELSGGLSADSHDGAAQAAGGEGDGGGGGGGVGHMRGVVLQEEIVKLLTRHYEVLKGQAQAQARHGSGGGDEAVDEGDAGWDGMQMVVWSGDSPGDTEDTESLAGDGAGEGGVGEGTPGGGEGEADAVESALQQRAERGGSAEAAPDELARASTKKAAAATKTETKAEEAAARGSREEKKKKKGRDKR